MLSTSQKIEVLGSSARYDICAATSVNTRRISPATGAYIGRRLPAGCCHVYTADGRCVSLFKVLMTNCCSNDCFYCQNSTTCLNKGNNKKTAFTPQELVHTFLEFYKRNYVEGLFLSSGITGDPEIVMEDMIEVGRVLRDQNQFKGYVHMKVLPGSSMSSIKELGRYADRLSLNLEAPTKGFLSEFSTTKDFNTDLITRLAWMHGMNERAKLPAGLTTQMIVGGNEATDHDIITTSHGMYKRFGLKRVYFSAFYPIKGSPLERHQATPLMREHRLYQVDWLLRCYGFKVNDVLPGKGCNLPMDIDPKLHFALQKRNDLFPVEINDATYDQLLLVPGIGPRSAKRILSLRNAGIVMEKLSMLKKIGVVVKRAQPFIKISGTRLASLDEWTRTSRISREHLT